MRFGAAISDAVARSSSIVLCNSVFAGRIVIAKCLLQLDIVKRIGVAASRLR